MSNLANQLAKQEVEEVSRGVRLLLVQPLLTAAADEDGFDLVRRRRDPIVKWFEYYCGWPVAVEPRYGYARLVKVTDRPDPTRPTDPDAVVSDTQRNLWLRHSVMRRLMDDPVVYRTDLTPAQLGYLASPTGRRVIHQGVQQAGCVLEERAEGYLVIDPDGIAARPGRARRSSRRRPTTSGGRAARARGRT